MRFLADENVSRLVIEQLRADGFDVTFIGETRSGTPDMEVLEAANAEGCILITEDHDFGELVIRQRLRIRGMILLELDGLSNAMEADGARANSHPPPAAVVTDYLAQSSADLRRPGRVAATGGCRPRCC